MLTSMSYPAWLRRLWQTAVEPPTALTDPAARHRARILNSILIVFISLAVVILVIYVLVLPDEYVGLSTTVLAILMGIGVALLIFVVNHSRYYDLARYVTILSGYVAIIVNAMTSLPPHFEIAYLIMLPLVGTVLLSFRETVVVCLLTIVSLPAFALMMGDIPSDIFKDLITFIIFVQVFILFLNMQRNQLELDRQTLAVERGRNTLLKQLISNLSHDFRTPLTVIITGVYLLGHIEDPAKQQEKRDQIHQHALRLMRMVEDILSMSILDQSFDQRVELGNLNDLLHTIHDQFKPLAEQANVRLQLELKDDLESFSANFDTLQLAFTNLVENAMSYTEPGGQITVRSFMNRDEIVVEVEDSGIGIAPQDLETIFMPFFRADKARSTTTGGMGLGLAIAKQVVELHGGTIVAKSVIGQGSTFRIRLPRAHVRS